MLLRRWLLFAVVVVVDVVEALSGQWVPNALTVGRVAAVPVVTGAIALDHQAVGRTVFAVASLTDFLDGYLARRWNAGSKFGAFLDPVADKLMVAAVLVAFTGKYGAIIGMPATVIICREIAVSALREWAASQGQRDVVQVGQAGKLKTTTQFLALLLLFGQHLSNVALGCLYLAAGLTLQSGYLLFKQGSSLFRGQKERSPSDELMKK